jgi:uncharacterized membrane protein
VLAALLSIVKKIVPDSETAEATVNALAVFIIFFNVIILIEITQTAFAIPPNIED